MADTGAIINSDVDYDALMLSESSAFSKRKIGFSGKLGRRVQTVSECSLHQDKDELFAPSCSLHPADENL